jgi:cell wall-associated NlpC family hydrolase
MDRRVTRRLALTSTAVLVLLATPAAASAERPRWHHPDRPETQAAPSAPAMPPVAPSAPSMPPAVPSTPSMPVTAPAPPQPAPTPQPSADRDDRRENRDAPRWDREERRQDPLLVPVPSSRRTVPGRVARLRTDGRAAIPRSAPATVKQALAAANIIIGKPYKWGGGHARLVDSGYDCSGAVGYSLIRSGLLGGSMTSGMLARWARAGDGRWISVYANRGHVYMEIAGLRLDTSRVGDPAGRSGVRWRPVIGRRTGFHARHPAGL